MCFSFYIPTVRRDWATWTKFGDHISLTHAFNLSTFKELVILLDSPPYTLWAEHQSRAGVG